MALSVCSQDESWISSYQIHFVVPDGLLQQDVTEPLKVAFEALGSNNLEPHWISFEEVRTKSESRRKTQCLFICDPFEGSAFEMLESRRCRVLGPLCVLRCLQDKESLPHKPYPVYSTCMRGLVVTCTNLSKEQKEMLKNRVQLMGGLFSKDLIKNVTHLVVGSVGSKKYAVAAANKTAIMTVEWVRECWEQAQHQLHGATDPRHLRPCPVFLDLRVTVSQLTSEERTQVQQQVEAHGGRYSGVLRAQETTHLVLKEPKGDKYKFAQQWRLPCVRIDWVLDSVAKGYCQDEVAYKLQDPSDQQGSTSTPKKEEMMVNPSIDCSSINASFTGVSQLSETAISNDMSIAPVVAIPPAALGLSNLELSEPALQLGKLSPFLINCHVFLSGFGGAEINHLTKLVIAGGGRIRNCLDATVTHVLLNESKPHDLRAGLTPDLKLMVLKKQWIMDCCKKGSSLNPSAYLVKEFSSFFPDKENLPIGHSHHKVSEDITTAPKIVPGQSPALPPPNADASPCAVANPQPEPDLLPDNGEVNPTLFSGFSFHVVGFSLQDQEFIERLVPMAGGKSASEHADIAVVPLPADDHLPTDAKVKVTRCWFEECIEQNKILPLKANPLFTPISVQDTQPLKELVLTFSQYTSVEKQTLIQLAEALGATNQEFLVRRANKARGLQANTHLILARPQGSKFQGTQKWKIPAVNKQWLIASSQTGVRAPEESFLVEDHPDEPEYVEDADSLKELIVKHAAHQTDPESTPPLPSSKIEEDVPEYFDIPLNELNAPFESEEIEAVSVVPLPNTNDPIRNEEDEDVVFVENVGGTVNQGSSPVLRLNKRVRELKGMESEKKQNREGSFQKDSDKSGLLSPMATSPQKLEAPSCSSPFNYITPTQSPISAFTPIQISPLSKLLPFEKQKIKFQTPKPNKILDILEKDPPRPVSDCGDTPSKFLDPQVPFIPKYDMGSILADFETPENKKPSKSRLSIPLDEFYDLNIGKALQNFGVKNAIDINKPEASATVASISNTSGDDIKTNLPLKGVVCYLAKKLNNSQNELHSIITSLGGEFKWSYDKTCTHFVFKGRTNDTNKEFRTAKDQGKKVVSPEWLFACRDEHRRVEEEHFPQSHNPRMTLSGEITKVASQTPSFYKKPQQKALLKDDSEINLPLPPILTDAGLESIMNLSLPMQGRLSCASFENVMSEDTKDKDSKGNVGSPTIEQPSDKELLKDTVGEKSPRDEQEHAEEEKEDENTFLPPAPPAGNKTGPSQSLPILWMDATGQVERVNMTTDEEDDDDTNKTPSSSSLTTSKTKPVKTEPKIFMLSGLSDNEKSNYSNIIEDLGGEVSERKNLDPNASHLILGQPLKNEKNLASIASGIWVLHRSYLDDSKRIGYFLEEEEYEWGGPKTSILSHSLSERLFKVAMAPRRWRQRFTSEGVKAFHGWKVVVLTDPSKGVVYERILSAGGATMLPSDETNSFLEATHGFLDPPQSSLDTLHLQELVSNGVKCFKPEYLALYLIENPIPNEDDFIIPEAAEMMTKPLSSSSNNQSTRAKKKKAIEPSASSSRYSKRSKKS